MAKTEEGRAHPAPNQAHWTDTVAPYRGFRYRDLPTDGFFWGMTAMRSTWVVVASAVVALSVASCSSSPAKSSQKPVATTTTTAAVTGCANDQIQVKYGKGLAGQGYEGAVILFTNVSPITCTLSGYPVVVAEDSANVQTPLQETINGPLGGVPQGSTKIPKVTLNQDGVASASIEAPNHPSSGGGTCPRYANILVGLPGGSPVYQLTATLPYLNVNLSACDPPPQVHPIFLGEDGY
jgi:hypothetical protein